MPHYLNTVNPYFKIGVDNAIDRLHDEDEQLRALILKLSQVSKEWLKDQPEGTIDRLIALAASDHWLAPHINKRVNPVGRKAQNVSHVTDDRLLELRAKGMSDRAIGREVGLSGSRVSMRLGKRVSTAILK